jgi:AcrR family transcriptional regulator
MIYYYFGSKEQLFEAVLEQAYSEIRAAEQDVRLDHLDPLAAIRRLAEITFDHHDALPDFVSLVRIESIHQAEHIRRSAAIVSVNSAAIELDHQDSRPGRGGGFSAASRMPLACT